MIKSCIPYNINEEFPGKTEKEEFITYLETEYVDKKFLVDKLEFTFTTDSANGECTFEYKFKNKDVKGGEEKNEAEEGSDGEDDKIQFDDRVLNIRVVPYEGNSDGILYELIFIDDTKGIEKNLEYRYPSFTIGEDDMSNAKEFFDISEKIIKKLIKDFKSSKNENIKMSKKQIIENKIRKIVKEEIQKLNEVYYSSEYHDITGGHGEIDSYGNFNQAYKSAMDLYKREKKENMLGTSTDYIGVSGDGDEFAVIFITKGYLVNVNSNAFKDNNSYKKWMMVAKKSLQTGKPQKGTY